MAQLGEAIARYHKLVEQDRFQEPVWAEQLQERMRQLHLTDSGRLLAPILRPHFVSRRQLDTLVRATAHLAEIFDRLAEVAFASPRLLNRLQMLPAEKMLAAIPSGYSRFNVTASMNANVQNGTLSLHGVDACKPAGLAYSDVLADLFLDLPLLKEFKRGRYRLAKLGAGKHLLQAIQGAWREFDRGKSKPTIAIVEMSQEQEQTLSEGHLMAETFSQQGTDARVIPPERLEYSGGKLRSGDFAIDVVFRRVLTREFLTRFDLSHPLMQAYRERAVCVVNGFRSEFAQRRSLFDLLTDESATTFLTAADRKLIRTFVPWTRVVSARKTTHLDAEVDLPEFILAHRETLALLPSEDASGQRVYIGAGMTQAAWDRALRLAMRTPYVAQERSALEPETFPVYQYGELKMKTAEVTVHPHIFNGQMHGASAVLHTCTDGSASQLAMAPVLLLETA